MKKMIKKITMTVIAAAMVLTGMPLMGIQAEARSAIVTSSWDEEMQLYNPYFASDIEYEIFTKNVDMALDAMDLEKKSDYEKCFTIYKYVTAAMRYDQEKENRKTVHAYLSSCGVCEDYADLYCHMLRKAGIDANVIEASDANCMNNHEWAVVELDGKWYFCDPSGDCDSAFDGYPMSYFLRGYESCIDAWYFRQGSTVIIDYKDNAAGFSSDDIEDEEEARAAVIAFLEEHNISKENYSSEKFYWHDAGLRWNVDYDKVEISYDESKDIPATCTTLEYRYCIFKAYKKDVLVYTDTFYAPCGAGEVGDMVGHTWEIASREYQDPYRESVVYECTECDATKTGTVSHQWSFEDEAHFCYACDSREEHDYGYAVKADGSIDYNVGKDLERAAWCGTGPYTFTCQEEGCKHELVIDNSDKTHDLYEIEERYKAPTCTQAGNRYYGCRNCSYIEVENIPSLNHDWVENVRLIEPTCAHNGEIVNQCSRCGETEHVSFIPKLSHEYEYTGTVDDKHVYTCKTCGGTKEEAHNYVYKKEASTCYQTGKSGYQCTVCGDWAKDKDGTEKGYNIVAKKSHSKQGEFIKYSTCTESGLYREYCTNPGCDYDVTEPVSPRGHKYVFTETTEEDKDKFTCSRCGDEVLKDHEYGEAEVVEPTCTETGYTKKVCANCGKELHEAETDALGHQYTSKVTKDATCTETGEMTHTCSRCGDSYTTEQPKASHDTEVKTIDPTCVADGYTADVCKDCGTELNKRDVTPATGKHSWKETVIAATCTEDGYIEKECTVCGKEDAETYEKAKGHAYENTVADPTCTEKGYTEHVCTSCGDTYRDDETDIVPHDYQITKKTKATCTTPEKTTYTCSGCGDTFTKETAKATGHAYQTVTVKATLSKDGSVKTTCTKCGNVSASKVIPRPKTFTVSPAVYTGKAQKPRVVVKDSKGKTIPASSYTVTYKNNTKIGTGTATVTFKGQYNGTKLISFEIVPKGTSVTSVKGIKKGITLKWAKQTKQTTGYQIQCSTSKKFTKKTTKEVLVKKNKTVSQTVTKLSAKKTYYVRVRTYKKVGKKYYYSGWSKVKAVKTK